MSLRSLPLHAAVPYRRRTKIIQANPLVISPVSRIQPEHTKGLNDVEKKWNTTVPTNQRTAPSHLRTASSKERTACSQKSGLPQVILRTASSNSRSKATDVSLVLFSCPRPFVDVVVETPPQLVVCIVRLLPL
ncbi:hypothetical protein BLNAU_12411 [Blattamonas nauphoetae]|uniref:Uncharacterized protein n=1 Tax=Blattamonas nauphoetae TaxID=2049346 RepID=A0ABQ9XJH1_9EUKA|nr:hypothetical protein BLNAU_12411 [Blattamonas nauphoetae]